MKHLLFALAALLCVPALSRAASSPNLEDMPAGALLCQAYLVRGSDYFDKVKADPKMSIESVTDGKRGDPLYLAVMFANPSKDATGIARVTWTFTMTYPDGKKVSGPQGLKGGDGPMSDAVQKSWIVANQKIQVRLSDQDPAGTYKLSLIHI